MLREKAPEFAKCLVGTWREIGKFLHAIYSVIRSGGSHFPSFHIPREEMKEYTNFIGLLFPECQTMYGMYYVHTLKPTCKVHGCKVFLHVRSVFGWSKSEIPILASNPDVRSARFYGQFSLDKTWTLQAGSSVLGC